MHTENTSVSDGNLGLVQGKTDSASRWLGLHAGESFGQIVFHSQLACFGKNVNMKNKLSSCQIFIATLHRLQVKMSSAFLALRISNSRKRCSEESQITEHSYVMVM